MIKFPFLLCVILAVAVATPSLAKDDPGFQFDWQPPAFVATTAPGQAFHYPEDLQGPTIVLFWATWCPYCKALMPHLQSIPDVVGSDQHKLLIFFE